MKFLGQGFQELENEHIHTVLTERITTMLSDLWMIKIINQRARTSKHTIRKFTFTNDINSAEAYRAG